MSTGGQIAGGVIGAVVGAYLGGPAGAFQGFAIGSGIGGYLDPPKGPTIEGPRLNDLAVQTSTYGAFIPRVYGTIGIHGNLLWLENNKLKETVRKKKQGGKGGGSSATVKTYSYSATFILALCQGPIAGVRRIWCADKLIYNAGSDDLETIIASNQAAAGWRLYLGTDDQMPDPRYEAEHGVGNVSAFRGIAYLAFYDFQLADYSNTLQAAQFKVEVVTDLDPTVPVLIKSVITTGDFVGDVSYGFQSAEIQTGIIEGGIGGTYTGEVIFHNYNFSDDLVYTESVFAEVPVVGSSDITFYKSIYIRGAESSMAAMRRSSPGVASFSSLAGNPITLNTGGSSPSKYWTDTTDYLWCHTSSGSARVSKQDRTVLNFSLPNAASSHEVYFIYEDSKTLKTYAKWAQSGSSGDAYFARIDPETATVIWSVVLGSGVSAAIPSSSGFYVHDSLVCLNTLGQLRVYDVSNETMQLVGSISKAGPHSVYYAADGVCFCDGDLYRVSMPSNIELVPLSYIVDKEISESGLIGSSDIDTSLLADGVRGYRVNGGTIRAALEPLQGAFPFDVIQSGYQITCVPRGQASVATIPWGDLGATDGDTPGDILQQSREMDSQLPASTTITVLDAEREYAVMPQTAARDNTAAINRVDRELPIVLTADEAAGVAEVLQNLAWLERTDFSFTLPPIYLGLEPSDVVTVTTPQATYQLRLTEVNYTPDGRLECKAKPNRAALYTPNATGGEGVVPDGTIGIGGPSAYQLLDIPVVDETLQNSPGISLAMTGYTGAWPGGILFRSSDEGQTWTDLQAMVGKCTFGYAGAAMPARSGSMVDRGSTLVVSLISGELESITEAQMLVGANYAAYGVNGRWEIIRFQNATLNGDGSYTLDTFVRGDRGTEQYTGTHQASDVFVLLDDPDNAFVNYPTALLGVPMTYRGITSGASIDTDTDQAFTYAGVNLECLSPVDARGVRDGSSNFTGFFYRRSRLSSSWWTNGIEAPVGEATQSYEVDVMNGSTVVRTIAVSTPTFSYSAANQTTDFGSPQSSITFRIFQISSAVGRGYVYEVTL